MQKAYKLLALQENISNNEAKALIDKGLVSIKGKRLNIARVELDPKTIFHIQSIQKPKVLFKDQNILALDKPAFIESYDLCDFFPEWNLLHRLDRETSGVILLIKKGSDFHIQAKEEFKKERVYKEYLSILEGILAEEQTITAPILTIKKGFAKSKISKDGLPAHTLFTPMQINGSKTLTKAIIKTGRTHQIRIHAKSISHPVIGDTFYGGKPAKRLMLHAHKIALLGYEFSSPIPTIFEEMMR